MNGSEKMKPSLKIRVVQLVESGGDTIVSRCSGGDDNGEFKLVRKGDYIGKK